MVTVSIRVKQLKLELSVATVELPNRGVCVPAVTSCDDRYGVWTPYGVWRVCNSMVFLFAGIKLEKSKPKRKDSEKSFQFLSLFPLSLF